MGVRIPEPPTSNHFEARLIHPLSTLVSPVKQTLVPIDHLLGTTSEPSYLGTFAKLLSSQLWAEENQHHLKIIAIAYPQVKSLHEIFTGVTANPEEPE